MTTGRDNTILKDKTFLTVWVLGIVDSATEDHLYILGVDTAGEIIIFHTGIFSSNSYENYYTGRTCSHERG
jgi:hypothetical protein